MSEEPGAQDLTYSYVLVVGPDGPDRAYFESTLLQGGFEVAASTEADLLPDIVPPALVLLDDARPKAERMEALKALRHHPALRGVPVAILAKDADIDSFSEAITKGAAAYLVKPVEAEELLATSRKLSGWMGTSDRTEKRRRLRRPLILKVEVESRTRKVKLPGQIVDVSGEGCRIELPEPVEVGEPLRVVLHGYDASTHVALGAEVRWRARSPDGAHTAGLKFTGTTALLAGKILGFMPTGTT